MTSTQPATCPTGSETRVAEDAVCIPHEAAGQRCNRAVAVVDEPNIGAPRSDATRQDTP